MYKCAGCVPGQASLHILSHIRQVPTDPNILGRIGEILSQSVVARGIGDMVEAVVALAVGDASHLNTLQERTIHVDLCFLVLIAWSIGMNRHL